MKIKYQFLLLVYKPRSASPCLKTCYNSFFFSSSFQAQAACFSAYRPFFRLQTKPGYFLSMKLGGCSMCSSSAIPPCRNAVLTSKCLSCIYLEAATLRDILVVWTTGTKASSESSPCICRDPFATSLTLQHSTSSSL